MFVPVRQLALLRHLCRVCRSRCTMYADVIQVCLYGCCRPNDSTSLCRHLGDRIEQVASWMRTNRLQLNAARRNSCGSFHHVDNNVPSKLRGRAAHNKSPHRSFEVPRTNFVYDSSVFHSKRSCIIDFPYLGLTYNGGWCLATYSDETPITRPSCEVNV